ncbi:hypothetical protein HanPI659440_Chr09g0335281 [Helianthus annuus]|nr:hypothetical protein HanPI659440_Chr09g0335281 [Helianthus annuus]
MWKGVVVAYIVVAVCYFPVAIIGRGAGFKGRGGAPDPPNFSVSDNILISLHDATWLIIMANVFVVLHVIGGYQVQKPSLCFTNKLNMYAMPVFDMIESVLVKKFNFAPSFKLRFITKNLYIGMCTASNKSRL